MLNLTAFLQLPMKSRGGWSLVAGGVAGVAVLYLINRQTDGFEDVRFSTAKAPSSITQPDRLSREDSRNQLGHLAQLTHGALVLWLQQLQVTDKSISAARFNVLMGRDIAECFEDDGHSFSSLDKLTWLGLDVNDVKLIVAAIGGVVDDGADAHGSDSPVAALTVQQAINKVAKHVGTSHLKTESGYGLMLGQPSRLMRAWLEAVSTDNSPLPTLELGAAYGVATLPALLLQKHVIANDRDAKQLQQLRSHWHALEFDAADRLTTLHGAVPSSLMALKAHSVSHVLASNIIHFLTPDELTTCFRELHRIMRPGAKLFLEADSPYIAGLGPLYTAYKWRRWLKLSYPGSFRFGWLLRFLAPDYFSGVRHYHLLDTGVLLNVLLDAGFHVETADYWPVEQGQDVGSTVNDGREIVVVIAQA
eukprot:TRINITY_DN12534_c2_g10_i1.p1 TRINITY_DN12534_c2_g10~~TRINITY_DN12534_c2_g10_i1.p1  ORF type:complete len:419 (+),score=71.69 TRINITY_DN12534_c2_g10_i1:55-1311(+)